MWPWWTYLKCLSIQPYKQTTLDTETCLLRAVFLKVEKNVAFRIWRSKLCNLPAIWLEANQWPVSTYLLNDWGRILEKHLQFLLGSNNVIHNKNYLIWLTCPKVLYKCLVQIPVGSNYYFTHKIIVLLPW